MALVISPPVMKVLECFDGSTTTRVSASQVAAFTKLPADHVADICRRLADLGVLHQAQQDTAQGLPAVPVWWPTLNGRRIIRNRRKLREIDPIIGPV